MADAAITNTCRKADCLVSQTGSCAEGHTPLASCPHFGAGSEAQTEPYDGELDDDSGDAPSRDYRISLPSGDALTSEEVNQFLRWRAAAFVTIIGDRDSGNTTLISALYDRFLRGPFAGLTFASSRTLLALERRSHHARVDSGRVAPETIRTSRLEGLRYFHFAVAPDGHPERRADLLLSDRSGEVYREARDNSGLVSTLQEIPQAQRLVLLLDGGRVASPFERNGALQAVRQTARALLDNHALGAKSVVQVVTTKIDLIVGNEEQAEIETALGAFRDRLARDFASRLGSLTFHDIAARDPSRRFEPAHGLDQLIADWAAPAPPLKVLTCPDVAVALTSEFDRLLIRTPVEALE
jgi:hypothetical protein